jgi:cytoskeletal protein RodZ
MEAEERRLMAEFDFDYSVKSSFDDHMDAYYAPPVMAAAGDPAALPAGGCRGSGIPARGGGKGAPATFFAPLAPSVATDTDLDANSTLPDYSLVEEGGGPHHQVVPLAPGGEDEEHGGVMLGVGVLGTGGHAPGRGGPNPATKSASSSLSSLRSLPFFSTLKVLLPSAISSSSAATRPATATASDAGQRQTKNSTVPRTPSRSGSSTGVSDTSSPTSKTQTPTATDSNGRQNTASNSSPSRKEGFVGGDGGAFGSGGGPTVAIGGVQDKSVPPSIIILGITRGDDYDDADDPTLGGHDPGANDGRTPAPPCSGEREKDGDDDRRRGLVRKTMHRLWSDWLGRVILLLLLAMMLSIGVAVGGLVAYRNRADATGASPSSTGSSTDSSTPGAPASASNSSDLDSADDDFFVAPPANLTAEDATDPPEAEGAIAPSAAPVAETEEPTSTDAPSHVRSTKPPSPAPAPTGEPSPSLVAMPPPPPPGDCQDDPNAIFFVNEQAGDRDCAFLADQPGIRDFLCQGEYDPSRVCPVTCGTCPDSSSSGTTANPTPSPTAAPIPATSEPTTPPTAEATAEATTAFPSPVPTASATAEPSSRSGAVSASLRAIIANVAPPSVLSRLDDGSSAPNQAFSWLERDFEAYGGLEVQVVQRYALATVAYSFQSDQWDDESGWLDSNAAECDWFGVSCDGSNRVTSIDLEQNGLRGTLPPELSLLSGSLSELNVNENSIGGELPTEVGLLGNLETLLMADNNFEGSLPTQVGRMESLTIWHLEKNAMTGSIPSTVENLENLAELSIWGNDFTGSASELCDLDNLQDLIVDCDSSIDCYARCYYQCGGDTGIDCTNRALIGGAIAYESA